MATAQARKMEKLRNLEILMLELFKTVEEPLDLLNMQSEDHVQGIATVRDLLLRVQELEKGIVARATQKYPPISDGQGRMLVLKEWLEANGVKLDGIELKSGLPEGCGVVATRALKEGEEILRVPHRLMMTTLTAVQAGSEMFAIFRRDPWLQRVPSLVLVMHLLFEKHRRDPPSQWQGYIRSLPGQHCLQETNVQGPDSMLLPLAFSMEAINELRGTTPLGEYHKQIRVVAKQYCRMRMTLHQLRSQSPAIEAAASEWFTFAEFRWAVSTVMMRQNFIPGIPANLPDGILNEDEIKYLGSTFALIPGMDMFNHEEGPMTAQFDVASRSMEITAKRDFKQGEQVYISYGSRPSGMMLLYNGFLPAVNTRDRSRLEVEIPKSDPLHAKKVNLVRFLLGLPPVAHLDLFADGTPSPGLCAWLRIQNMTDEAQVTEELKKAITIATAETAKKMAAREAEQKRQLEAVLRVRKAKEGQETEAEGREGQSGEGTQAGPASEEAEGLANGGKAPEDSQANGTGEDEFDAQQDEEAARLFSTELGAAEAELLKQYCQARLDALCKIKAEADASRAAAGVGEMKLQNGGSDGPQGLGLGLKKGAKADAKKENPCTAAEVALTKKLFDSEVETYRKAIALCTAKQ